MMAAIMDVPDGEKQMGSATNSPPAGARLYADALQRVEANQLREFQKVGHTAGPLERLVELFARSRYVHVLVELGA